MTEYEVTGCLVNCNEEFCDEILIDLDMSL